MTTSKCDTCYNDSDLYIIQYSYGIKTLCSECLKQKCNDKRIDKDKLYQLGISYCRTCKSIKKLDEFRNVDGWYYICTNCDNADAKTRVICPVCNKKLNKSA